jgi:CcmD family protein
MIQDQPKPASSSPDDRAQTFEAQQGSPIPEAHSGERLLVTAYMVIWVLAMGFVLVMWMRQRTISRRIDALERAIDKAEQKRT